MLFIDINICLFRCRTNISSPPLTDGDTGVVAGIIQTLLVVLIGVVCDTGVSVFGSFSIIMICS